MKTKKILLIPLSLLLVGFFFGTVFMASNEPSGTIVEERFEVENAPFFDIFFNNFKMCLMFVVGCGALSSVMALVQGFSFGTLFGVWITMGNSAADFSLLFLPHVIFEVAAILLACMIGFSILSRLMFSEKEPLSHFIKLQIPKLCAACLCVLAGAVVESFLTPAIYNLI